MKYLPGISLPSAVCAELGKNGPFGPSPSWSMVSGAAGFRITLRDCHARSRSHQAAPESRANTSKVIDPRSNQEAGEVRVSDSRLRRARHEEVNDTTSRNTASSETAMCT